MRPPANSKKLCRASAFTDLSSKIRDWLRKNEVYTVGLLSDYFDVIDGRGWWCFDVMRQTESNRQFMGGLWIFREGILFKSYTAYFHPTVHWKSETKKSWFRRVFS